MTTYKYRQLRVDAIYADRSYQRVENSGLSKLIAVDFVEGLMLPLCVNCRPDGSYWVMDGQTRLKALKLMDTEKVNCLVYELETVEREAQMFVGLNRNRKQLRYPEVFHGRIRHKCLDALKIVKIVKDAGFELKCVTAPWPCICATKGLENCSDLGTLPEALKLIEGAWNGVDKALHASMIESVGTFVFDHGMPAVAEFSRRLSSRLPATLIAEAQARQVSGYTRVSMMSEIINESFIKRARRKNGRP